MKIMSLNVNQFRALRLLEGCRAKDIALFVKGFLCEDANNAAFLYEVPYYDCVYHNRLELFDDFLKEFRSYKVYYSHEKAYICTLAITNEESEWEPASDEFRFKVEDMDKNGRMIEVFKNRFIELICKHKNDDEDALRVLGVHASLKEPFLESLAKHIEKVPFSKFIVLGDLNCHRGEASSYRNELKQMETKLFDLVTDKSVTYFPGKTTIDHVLVSPALREKATAKVMPQEKLALSDHAIIIADVDVQPANKKMSI